MDINGTFRNIFCASQSEPGVWISNYVGADIVAGKGVDLLMGEYSVPVQDGAFDVIISGNTMEHVRKFWVLLPELARVLRSGGLMILSVPGQGWGKHEHPEDCWRFMPESMNVMLDDLLGFEVLAVCVEGKDVIGVGRKP